MGRVSLLTWTVRLAGGAESDGGATHRDHCSSLSHQTELHAGHSLLRRAITAIRRSVHSPNASS